MRQRGYNTGALWRGAWFRNNAPAAPETKDMFYAFPMYRHGVEYRVESFPFINRYNVSRFILHGQPFENVDALFDKIKNNRGIAIVYTHRVNEGTSVDMSYEEWDYFLGKLDEGLSEGWLEGTTFSKLIKPYINETSTVTFNKR